MKDFCAWKPKILYRLWREPNYSQDQTPRQSLFVKRETEGDTGHQSGHWSQGIRTPCIVGLVKDSDIYDHWFLWSVLLVLGNGFSIQCVFGYLGAIFIRICDFFWENKSPESGWTFLRVNRVGEFEFKFSWTAGLRYCLIYTIIIFVLYYYYYYYCYLYILYLLLLLFFYLLINFAEVVSPFGMPCRWAFYVLRTNGEQNWWSESEGGKERRKGGTAACVSRRQCDDPLRRGGRCGPGNRWEPSHFSLRMRGFLYFIIF